MPLGSSTVVTESGDAHILERQPFGHELGGIELDADRGLLLAADVDLGDAGNLADLLGELGLDIVVDLGQRQEFEVAASRRMGESAGFTLR